MATLSSTPMIGETNQQPFVKEPIHQSINLANEAERDMQQNRIPTDNEDPSLQTKALPFASTNEQECEDLIKSGEEPSISSSNIKSSVYQAKGVIKQTLDHNGNVLDRTMDQIRGWVQSFKTEPQYEEYEVEVDEDSQSLASSAKSTINQASASINQASESAKQSAAQASASAKQSLNQASTSAKQSVNQASASAKQSLNQASASTKQAANQASNKLGQIKDSAAVSINQLSNQASEQAKVAQSKLGSLKDQVVHTVSDLSTSLNQTVHQYYDSGFSGVSGGVDSLKSSVNEFVASHPSINESINQATSQIPSIPSSDSIRDYSSKMLPPLAQQASSSWAFAGSFLAQYFANMKEFMLALRQQNVVVLALTALTFVNHFVLPWFFLDKHAARSVIYSYVLASLAAHFTFFVSGHLRYQWLGHLLFVPMVLSLLFNQGFREAGDVAELIDSFKQGDRFGTAFAAPFSLRSYLFVIWMRGILMNQAVLGTFDLINVMDLLGLSLGTQLGEEMPLIQGSVKNFRRSLAASVHGAADSLDVNERAAAHRGHGRKRRGSAQSQHPAQSQSQSQQPQQQRVQKTSSPAPQQQIHSSQQSHSAQPQQHWVKKSQNPSEQSSNQSLNQSSQSDKILSDKPAIVVQVHPKSDDSSVIVESHERSSNELRQRHTAQSTQ